MSISKFSKKDEGYLNDGLRAAFKEGLTKLIQINTREQASKELKSLIMQNKTTINLRVWLSVLAENRNRHNESEINIITFIIQQYGKGLLDPLDKVPSLEKTVFRITELMIKLYFNEQGQNVALALQRSWVEIYMTVLIDEDCEQKKKLLYNNLEAILNGGADKISQMTGQFVLDGLLESSLNKEDILFFKQIAKRTLVLFLKTTIIHPSVLTCLQTVLGYFNITNLIPLLENIVNKIVSYISLTPNNALGYKIKAEACNALSMIGEQIDQNGVNVCERIMKTLQNLATDKVWAVQVTGRKAVAVWRRKKKEWQEDYNAKNEVYFPTDQNFYKPPAEEENKWVKQRPMTADNFNSRQQRQSRIPPQQPRQTSEPNNRNSPDYKFPDYTQDRYLHKNTGIGGGNTVQSVEQYYQRQRPQETYSKKMEEIKKSIYQPKEEVYTEYDETVPWDQARDLPKMPEKRMEPARDTKNQTSAIPNRSTTSEFDQFEDDKYLQNWQRVVSLFQQGKKEESVKAILQLDDDIYFLRFMLKYSKGLLQDLTKATAGKVLKQMLAIKRTNFMEQLFFKLVAESSKIGASQLLTNQQNFSIVDKLQQCSKMQGLEKIAIKLRKNYESSLSE